ncbi:hypothetical protein [Pseudomonas edaphica]|uniref:hypothetical protein n=1 Tax=Pseudomonas edaphica TaxID=2006980 RepID=UPI003D097C8D
MLLILVLKASAAGATWLAQDWRFGKKLAVMGEAQALILPERWPTGRTSAPSGNVPARLCQPLLGRCQLFLEQGALVLVHFQGRRASKSIAGVFVEVHCE